MPDTLVKLKTGTVQRLEQKNQDQTPTVALDEGTVYFAVDTTTDPNHHTGKIVYDAPDGNNGVTRIVMGTLAEYADQSGQFTNGRLIEGVKFDNSANIAYYAVCSTAANVRHKTIICPNFGVSPDGQASSLVNGARIIIRYANENTVANPTLTISNGIEVVGTSQIPIYYINSPMDATKILENSVHEYIYDSSMGTSGAWVYVGSVGSDINITMDNTTNTLYIHPSMINGDEVSY